MINVEGLMSCAIMQVSGLPESGKRSFKTVLIELLDESDAVLADEVYVEKSDDYETKFILDKEAVPAFYLFVQARQRSTDGWVTKFAAWIEKQNLGVVTRSETRENPNTNNFVTIFVWAINFKELEAWVGLNHA